MDKRVKKGPENVLKLKPTGPPLINSQALVATLKNQTPLATMISLRAQILCFSYCRARAARKRGGGEVRLTLSGLDLAEPAVEVDVLAVDRILTHLETLDSQQVRIVELRFFAGLTVEETGAALGVSRTTVKREWAMARASILCALLGQGQGAGSAVPAS